MEFPSFPFQIGDSSRLWRQGDIFNCDIAEIPPEAIRQKHLVLAVVFAIVGHACRSLLAEMLGHTVYLRLGAEAAASQLRGRLALHESDNDFASASHHCPGS
jgi:hypothetical protein